MKQDQGRHFINNPRCTNCTIGQFNIPRWDISPRNLIESRI